MSEISEMVSMKEIPESVAETESPEPAPESALVHNPIDPPKKILEGCPSGSLSYRHLSGSCIAGITLEAS